METAQKSWGYDCLSDGVYGVEVCLCGRLVGHSEVVRIVIVLHRDVPQKAVGHVGGTLVGEVCFFVIVKKPLKYKFCKIYLS
jgi:hypothetical protein